MLGLTERVGIQRVRHVERRARGLHVEMECAGRAGAGVDSIEQRHLVPGIVQDLELRRIQEAIRPHAGHRQEIADVVRPGTKVHVDGGRLERTVPQRHAAGRLRLVEARLGDDMHDEAAFVAVFGRRDPCNDLHRLHGILRNLVRVQTTLLIRHRLVVDRELRLGMVPDGMEESVRVGDDAWRRERDHLVQARRRIEGQLLDQALVDVRVRAGIAFQEVLGVPNDFDRAGRAGEDECQINRDGHCRPHVHIALERLEALRLD